MSTVYTIQDLIEQVTLLDPAAAATATNGTLVRLCSTDLVERIKHGGQIIDLAPVNGRYQAGYIRVSLERQRTKKKVKSDTSEHYSEADQVRRIALDAIQKRHAFRLYSDAALSGGLPYNSDELIHEMRSLRSERYRSAFEAVFLTNHDDKYKPQEITSMREYMEQTVRKIASGKTDYELALEAGETEAYRERQRGKKRIAFRPALTCLISDLPSIHTLTISDLSRLSRNYQILANVLKHLHKNKVQIKGILQPLEFLNSKDAHAELLLFVLAWLDGLKLHEVILQNLRTAEAVLLSGRPHTRIPSWLKRDKNGYAVIDENKASPIREMVRLFLEGEGYAPIARRLAEQFDPIEKYWLAETVKTTLSNPALAGKQYRFGKYWDTLPSLVDDFTWHQIRQRRTTDSDKTGLPKNPDDCYLMTGLLKCPCGLSLTYQKHPNGMIHYKCKAESHQRQLQRHIILFAPDVEAFFNEFMQYHSVSLLDFVQNADYAKRMREKLNSLLEQAAGLEREEYEAHQELRPRAEEFVREEITPESDPEFDAWVRKRLEKLTHGIRQRRDGVDEEIRVVKAALDAVLPSADFQQPTKDWAEMTNLEKNRLLKHIFKAIYVEGDAPNESLVPVLRTPPDYRLPPIRFESTPFARGYKRRLISVEQYKQRWGWEVREEDGEQVTVAHIPPLPADVLEKVAPDVYEEMLEFGQQEEDERLFREALENDPELAAAYNKELQEQLDGPMPPVIRKRVTGRDILKAHADEREERMRRRKEDTSPT